MNHSADEIDDLFAEIIETETLGSVASFSQALMAQKNAARQAIAKKTQSRRYLRRAKSEEHLCTILPARIEQGDAWHVLTAGDVDSLTFFAHAIKTQPFDQVLFSTWCMALEDVLQLGRYIAEGKLRRLDAYVGEIFPNQYADEYAALCAVVRPTGGRVCTFRNHSKIFACRAGDYALVIESSANVNTNPRTENTVLTADLDLFLFQKSYFDGVHSFNRDFDTWRPA